MVGMGWCRIIDINDTLRLVCLAVADTLTVRPSVLVVCGDLTYLIVQSNRLETLNIRAQTWVTQLDRSWLTTAC